MSRKTKDSGIEWIRKVPEDWEVIKLKHIGKFTASGIDKKIIEGQPLVKIINYTDVYGNEKMIIDDTFVFMEVSSDEERRTKNLVTFGDLIFTPSSETKEEIGQSALVNVNLLNTAFSYHVLRFQFYREVYHPYKKYLTNNAWIHSYFASIAQGTTRQILSRGQLGDAKVLLPTYSEQRKIANLLEEKLISIDQILADTKQSIEELKTYRQAVITEAVTKGLDKDAPMKDSGIEWIGEIPEDWSAIKFGKIAFVDGKLVNPLDYPDYQQVSSDSIEKNAGRIHIHRTVSESEVNSNNYLFKKGQILYSKIRPKLNKVALAPFDGLCSADMYPLTTHANPIFVVYLIMSDYFLQQVILATENRVKMPKINQEELKKLFVALPPAQIQIEVVKYLDKFKNEYERLIQEKVSIISDMEEYKKSLIYEYVTGKKEVV